MKWLNPFWVVGGAASVGVLIVGMNLLLRRQVRLRTAALKASLAAQEDRGASCASPARSRMELDPHEYLALAGAGTSTAYRSPRARGRRRLLLTARRLDERRLYVTLGDVSDKGAPAALFMAATKTRLGAAVAAAGSPAAVLTRVEPRHGPATTTGACS